MEEGFCVCLRVCVHVYAHCAFASHNTKWRGEGVVGKLKPYPPYSIQWSINHINHLSIFLGSSMLFAAL